MQNVQVITVDLTPPLSVTLFFSRYFGFRNERAQLFRFGLVLNKATGNDDTRLARQIAGSI